MRLPLIIATLTVGFSFAYRWFAKKESATAKTVFSWGFILVMLSIVGNTPLASTADLFAYIIIMIIVLNDGYDFTKELT